MTKMLKILAIAVIIITVSGIFSPGCSVTQTSNSSTTIQTISPAPLNSSTTIQTISSAPLNSSTTTQTISSPKPFPDLDTLKAWLSTQPPTQPIIFYTPVNTDGYRIIDYLRENKNDTQSIMILDFAKTVGSQDSAKLSCQRALALQQAALKDGYLISMEYINIGDQVNVGLNYAILSNGDEYSISTDVGSTSIIFIENNVTGSQQ